MIRLRRFGLPVLAGLALSSCGAVPASTSFARVTVAPRLTAPPTSATEPASSVPPATPVTTTTVLPPVVPVTGVGRVPRPDDDVRAGLDAVQAGVLECLADAVHCDTASLAVPGSVAFAALESVRRYYVRLDLTLLVVPELTYVVPERIEHLGPDRVRITLCEADGSWQMDRNGTPATADDVVWNDHLVSRRSAHVLVREGGRWRRSGLEILEEWRGENRCPPPAA